jgi:hypothetical protein
VLPSGFDMKCKLDLRRLGLVWVEKPDVQIFSKDEEIKGRKE